MRMYRWGFSVFVLMWLPVGWVMAAATWAPLAKDGIHDPANPAVTVLQEPKEAFSNMPRDEFGNFVSWVKALQEGYIAPRSSRSGEGKDNILDLDVLLPDTGAIPMVRFPHKAHTEWLDCSNCHDHIFKPKAGSNPISMGPILDGKFCGLCHGKVAFPLTACKKCHSVEREKK